MWRGSNTHVELLFGTSERSVAPQGFGCQGIRKRRDCRPAEGSKSASLQLTSTRLRGHPAETPCVVEIAPLGSKSESDCVGDGQMTNGVTWLGVASLRPGTLDL